MDTKAAPPPAYNETGSYGMQQGYPAPNQGYAPPPQGYAPPPQGYGAPQQGYGAPQQGYPTGQPGYPGQPATVVVQQPYPAGTVIHRNAVPDYFVASILACLCCFWPTGLCAIYYANRSRTLLAEGNIAESTRMANNARNLIITSVVLGICWIVLVIVLRVVVYSTTTSTYRRY